MYVYVCVCIYAGVYVCMYVCMYVYSICIAGLSLLHVRMYVCMCDLHVRMYVCMCDLHDFLPVRCVRMYISIYLGLHAVM